MKSDPLQTVIIDLETGVEEAIAVRCVAERREQENESAPEAPREKMDWLADLPSFFSLPPPRPSLQKSPQSASAKRTLRKSRSRSKDESEPQETPISLSQFLNSVYQLPLLLDEDGELQDDGTLPCRLQEDHDAPSASSRILPPSARKIASEKVRSMDHEGESDAEDEEGEERGGGEVSADARACFTCGATDHFSRDCPEVQ